MKRSTLRNPTREQQRLLETARSLERVDQLKADLPEMIVDKVGDQVQKLEDKLLKEFQQMGQKVVEEKAVQIQEQLAERIESLEQISALQSQTLRNLRESSRIADEKVSSVVNNVERTLAGAVPGFALEPPQIPQSVELALPASVAQFATEVVPVEHNHLEELKGNYYCPYCTSSNIRRANRTGVFEEFLRLFFIAPFRCRSCRKKFYRF